MNTARLTSWLMIFTVAIAVTACGGSSSNQPPPEPDPDPAPPSEPVTTPEAFSFPPASDVEPGAIIVSEPAQILGIDAAADVTVEGAEYRIDGGEFTSEPGEINNEQRLTLQAQAPNSPDSTKEVTVTVGGVTGRFVITTMQDNEPPEAAIVFPTPMSATYDDSLTIRGTASDRFSAISAVTLTVENSGRNEYEAVSSDGFATWSVEVDLAPGDNVVTVSTEDERGNRENEAWQLTVRQQDFRQAFPEEREVEFQEVYGLALDKANWRVLLSDNDYDKPLGQRGRLISVDIATGAVSVFSGQGVPDDDNVLGLGRGITIDRDRNVALWASLNDESIYTVNLESGERQRLSSPTLPGDDQPEQSGPTAIAIDPKDLNIAYVVAAGSRHLSRLNLETGAREVVSDDSRGEGPELMIPTSSRLIIDSPNDVAYIIDQFDQPLFRVSLESGDREIVDFEGYPSDRSAYPCPRDIASDAGRTTLYIADCSEGLVTYDLKSGTWALRKTFELSNKFTRSFDGYLHLVDETNLLFFAERGTSGLYLMDLETDQYVILSKSSTESGD